MMQIPTFFKCPLTATVPRAATGVCLALLLAAGAGLSQTPGEHESHDAFIPAVETTALDGHAVTLPRALPGRATVLILGFGKHSADATTAWEKPVRMQLAHSPAVGFYDMAMLQEVPSFVRPLVLRSVRKDVPDVLKPNFLPLFDHEDQWKHVAGYAADQPEAAYVMVVDRKGVVRWSTHQAFSPEGFNQLRGAVQQVGGL